jgi:hypothetical protein
MERDTGCTGPHTYLFGVSLDIRNVKNMFQANNLDIRSRFSQNCEKRLLASACLSVCPPAWNNSDLTGRFSWHLLVQYFSKIWQEYRILCMKTYVNLWQYLAEFLLEWEIFQTKVIEKIKTYFISNNFFSPESWHLWDNVEKYFRAGQATGDIIRRMRLACWINKTTNTYRMCNTYWFSTAKMVTRTPVSITLYVQCLSCRALYFMEGDQFRFWDIPQTSTRAFLGNVLNERNQINFEVWGSHCGEYGNCDILECDA